ncbi:MAG: hypothetical protein DRH37_08580 [Deltaproteobacteria bacterium]|nr:MAG: hypothetical protein DRH37_08580 [Deltaproteobacteria bacterium]
MYPGERDPPIVVGFSSVSSLWMWDLKRNLIIAAMSGHHGFSDALFPLGRLQKASVCGQGLWACDRITL